MITTHEDESAALHDYSKSVLKYIGKALCTQESINTVKILLNLEVMIKVFNITSLLKFSSFCD